MKTDMWHVFRIQHASHAAAWFFPYPPRSQCSIFERLM